MNKKDSAALAQKAGMRLHVAKQATDEYSFGWITNDGSDTAKAFAAIIRARD